MIGKGEDKAMIVISQTSHIGGAKQQRQSKQASKQASSGDEGLGSPGSLSVVTYVVTIDARLRGHFLLTSRSETRLRAHRLPRDRRHLAGRRSPT